jgi:hypothetical protein
MKKAISIFFLFIFFLFQYGKILDYMECRIVAAIAPQEDCGCDTKLTTGTSTNEPIVPLHQHHLKNYTEEFFEYPMLIQASILSIERAYKVVPSEKLPSGSCNSIFQPPRA